MTPWLAFGTTGLLPLLNCRKVPPPPRQRDSLAHMRLWRRKDEVKNTPDFKHKSTSLFTLQPLLSAWVKTRFWYFFGEAGALEKSNR